MLLTISAYVNDAQKLVMVCGAICALIGAVKVYRGWQSGNDETYYVALQWFGACLTLVFATMAVKAFFKY